MAKNPIKRAPSQSTPAHRHMPQQPPPPPSHPPSYLQRQESGSGYDPLSSGAAMTSHHGSEQPAGSQQQVCICVHECDSFCRGGGSCLVATVQCRGMALLLLKREGREGSLNFGMDKVKEKGQFPKPRVTHTRNPREMAASINHHNRHDSTNNTHTSNFCHHHHHLQLKHHHLQLKHHTTPYHDKSQPDQQIPNPPPTNNEHPKLNPKPAGQNKPRHHQHHHTSFCPCGALDTQEQRHPKNPLTCHID